MRIDEGRLMYFERRDERRKAMEKAKQKEIEDRGFMKGFAVAAFIISKTCGLADVKTLIQEGGFTVKSFSNQGIDPADLKVIREAMKR